MDLLLVKILCVLGLSVVGLISYHTQKNVIPQSGAYKTVFEIMRAASIIWIALGLTFLVAYLHHYPL